MSHVIEVIQQPAPIVQVVQQPTMIVEVEMPTGVSSVDAPLTYDSVTQRLGFDPTQVTGLPPSATTGTAVVDADPRLSNARTPTAHKASHATGGSDALTPGDIGAEPAGTAAAGMASHLAAADPHPQYTTAAEAAAAAPVQSVAGKTGAVTLTPADAGADPAGTASAAVAAHVAAADPHTQYTTAARVRDVVLTGLSAAVNAAVSATDSILAAFGKLQAQITAHVGTGGAAHADATTSAAGFMAAADKTKLDGIAAGATANATDAQLRDRATHTGTQSISTVSGLQTALDGKEPAGAASASMTAHLAAADPHSQYTTAAEAAAAAPVQSVAGRTGAVTLAATDITDSTAAGRGVLTAADAAAQRTALGLAIGTDVQAYDADLQAIAALSGTAGLLRKTAANTWSLETASYLTGNQTVAISGDATGSGATAITLSLAASGVTAGTYNDSATAVRPFTVDAKGRVTAVGAAVTITPAWASVTGKPTTLAGYGIADAQPLDADLTTIAALAHAADNFLVSNGTAWVRETPAEALVSLGLGSPTGTGNVVRATSPTVADPTVTGQARFAAGTAAAPALTTTGDLDTGVFFPSANTCAVATSGAERMRIASGGNVAIGGTNAVVKLAIYDSNVGLVVLNSTDPAAATSAPMLRHPVASGFSSTPAYGFWYSNAGMSLPAAETLGLVTNNTERMRIDASGNVGIGGSTAATTTLSLLNNRAAAIYAQTWDTFNGVTFENSLLLGFNGSSAFFGNFQNFPLFFVTNNTERMRITSAGNVGIGTSSPGYRLDVVDGFTRIGAFNTTSFPNSHSLGGAAFGWNRSGYAAEVTITNVFDNAVLSFEFAQKTGASTANVLCTMSDTAHRWLTGGFERMRIDSAGNVGINTSAPNYLLTLQGASNPQVWVSATNVAGNGAGIGFENQGQRNWQIWADRTIDTLSFGNNSRVTTNLVITSAGDVGIGVTSPSAKLHVDGQIRTAAPTGGTAANWRLGTVHTVSPTSPNRTIEVDIGGTIYYLHAKTTNN